MTKNSLIEHILDFKWLAILKHVNYGNMGHYINEPDIIANLGLVLRDYGHAWISDNTSRADYRNFAIIYNYFNPNSPINAFLDGSPIRNRGKADRMAGRMAVPRSSECWGVLIKFHGTNSRAAAVQCVRELSEEGGFDPALNRTFRTTNDQPVLHDCCSHPLKGICD